MNREGVIPLDRLPVQLSGPRAPVWWGMLLLVVIEVTVFATLFSSYLYLRFRAAQWPPEGMPLADPRLPGLNTLVLIASAAAVYVATRAVKKGDVRGLKMWLGAGVGLAVVFFAVKLVGIAGLEFRWDGHAYGSIHWTITLLHGVHVAAAILMGTVAWALALKGYFTAQRVVGMQVVSIYWTYVTAGWIAVYVVLYWAPRWF